MSSGADEQPGSGVYSAAAEPAGVELLQDALRLACTLEQALAHEPRLLALAALSLLAQRLEFGARAKLGRVERIAFFRELEAVRRLCQRISVAPGKG